MKSKLIALDAPSERLSRNNTHVVVSHARQIAAMVLKLKCWALRKPCLLRGDRRRGGAAGASDRAAAHMRQKKGSFCKNYHLVFGELDHKWQLTIWANWGICILYHCEYYINSHFTLQNDSDLQVCLSIASSGSILVGNQQVLSYKLHTAWMNPEVSKVLSVVKSNLKPTYFTHIENMYIYIYMHISHIYIYIYLMYLHLQTNM